MSDMWTAPEDDPRSYGNPIGGKATYREYLGNYRLIIEMKCEGRDASQLAARSVPPSTLSLFGLVRHLAQVENHWFQRVLQGRTDGTRLYQREGERTGISTARSLTAPLRRLTRCRTRRGGAARRQRAGHPFLAPLSRCARVARGPAIGTCPRGRPAREC